MFQSKVEHYSKRINTYKNGNTILISRHIYYDIAVHKQSVLRVIPQLISEFSTWPRSGFLYTSVQYIREIM